MHLYKCIDVLGMFRRWTQVNRTKSTRTVNGLNNSTWGFRTNKVNGSEKFYSRIQKCCSIIFCPYQTVLTMKVSVTNIRGIHKHGLPLVSYFVKATLPSEKKRRENWVKKWRGGERSSHRRWCQSNGRRAFSQSGTSQLAESAVFFFVWKTKHRQFIKRGATKLTKWVIIQSDDEGEDCDRWDHKKSLQSGNAGNLRTKGRGS